MVATSRFLKTDSIWVWLREEERAFENTAAAIDYCIAHGIEGARLYLSFGNPAYDLTLDVFRVEGRLPQKQPVS